MRDSMTVFICEINRVHFTWLRDAQRGPLQVMYGLDGRHDLDEISLDHLSGYGDPSPKEARQQDICIRQIKLTYAHIPELRSNLKSAASLIIEERSKDRWRIEFRVAQEIDRAVHPYQRNRLHVSDHAVIFNWFKGHETRVIVMGYDHFSFIEQTPKTQGFRHSRCFINLLSSELVLSKQWSSGAVCFECVVGSASPCE